MVRSLSQTTSGNRAYLQKGYLYRKHSCTIMVQCKVTLYIAGTTLATRSGKDRHWVCNLYMSRTFLLYIIQFLYLVTHLLYESACHNDELTS